jgi:hypothetical protein
MRISEKGGYSIKGSSKDNDVLILEWVLGGSNVFVHHNPVAMDNAYFWGYVSPRIHVGLHRDQDKTFISHTEHEKVLVASLVAGVVPDDEDNENGGISIDISNQQKDNLMSLGSNAESVVDDSDRRDTTCEMSDDDMLEPYQMGTYV